MTLNLGGGTSFLFSNEVPVPPRPSQTASFAYGKRPRRLAMSNFSRWTYYTLSRFQAIHLNVYLLVRL